MEEKYIFGREFLNVPDRDNNITTYIAWDVVTGQKTKCEWADCTIRFKGCRDESQFDINVYGKEEVQKAKNKIAIIRKMVNEFADEVEKVLNEIEDSERVE